MAFRNLTKGLKYFFGPNNRFFNGAREEETSGGEYYAQQSAAPAAADYAPRQNSYQQPQNGYFNPQQGYQQPFRQGYQPQQQAYQQPQPQTYQQQPQYQPDYQQPQQQEYGFQQQTVNQAYVPPRNRRTAQHAQARENVVPFPGAAAQQQPQQPQQSAAPQQAAPASEQKKPSACVINVRNIGDCRSAIGILRSGDCVIAVIDSIADQAEVRRYVDTLNGACFSLGCTMTRTSSRVGVYFLAPANMQVLTDQTTTQMNQQSRAPQRPRAAQPTFQNVYAAPQTAFSARPAYAAPQQPQYSAPQQPAYQQPQAAYAAQDPAQGYSPDQQNADYPQEATM